MADGIHGIKVDGTTYQYDYNYLANNPVPVAGDSYYSVRLLAADDSGNLSWNDLTSALNPDGHRSSVLVADDSGNVVWVAKDSFLA